MNNLPEIAEGTAADGLGQRVRELRTRAGLTLELLAQRTGVSRAMLSKLERGAASPTIGVATRVARGLDVSLGQLVGLEERWPAVLVPASKRLVFTDPETGVTRHIFPALAGSALDFQHLTLPPGSSTGPLPVHRTGSETYIVVGRGQLRVRIGVDEYRLTEEDVLHFGGDVVHEFANDGVGECHCLMFATPGRA